MWQHDEKIYKTVEKDQFSQVRGTGIPKLKSTQAQNEELKKFKSKAQKALHFSTLFGLELDYLKLKDPDSFKTLTVEFHNASVSDKSDSLLSSSPKTSQNNTFTDTPPCTPGTSQPSFQTQFSRLSEDDKARV